ncbi:hypothetical protein OROHE_025194 [Orobanche hederae]
MGEDKQGAMVVGIPTNDVVLTGQPEQNPIAVLQVKLKEVDSMFRGWVAKQSLPVETAIVTAISGAQGAAIGAFTGLLTADGSFLFTPPPNVANLNPNSMPSLTQTQVLLGGPLVQARNFAVMAGANAGISCVMRRLRGKEDVQSSMVSAFGSGAMFALVSGVGVPNPVANALTTGLFFAFIQGGIFKLGQKFSQPQTEDVYYVKTRSMLSNLGLQNYEKNFKRGLLTDITLPLLTERALSDVRIPPGPRLLILDHIESRNGELKRER